MYVVSFLFLAVQVAVPSAYAGNEDGRLYLWIALVVGVLALGAALMLARAVIASDTGTAEMRAISDAIREGAEAFLRRQYTTIGEIAAALAIVVFVGYHMSSRTSPYALKTVISFLVGAVCSGLAGYTGMYCSIRANIRTASAARTSLNKALQMALRGGAVTGLVVVALSLLGVGSLFLFFGGLEHPETVPYQLVGFGFGASFVALFAQLGGGIYTKPADVGADLVGNVEAGIPEDDPRNPAVIADLVGATLAASLGEKGMGFSAGVVGVMLFPLVARAFGLLAAIVGILMVKTREDQDPMQALNRGYYVAAALAIAGFFVATKWLLANPTHPDAWWKYFLCGVIGVLTSIAFVYITQYYTEYRYRPVREIAEASQTGPATNIITGIAVGFECTALPTLTISAAILLSYFLGKRTGIDGAGLFGTAVATMGMLATAAYILAMDTFGPITDNAGGIVEMSHQPEDIRKKTDRLDAVGNTTKALTKGYAIGSAALAAFLLFSAYLDEVRNYGFPITSVDISKPEVFVGGLLGAMLVFLFSALAIRAVSQAAQYVIMEVRRQFKEKPGILAGTERPDYGRCVDIVTRGALRQMVLPGILAVAMPIVTGVVFKAAFHAGAEAVAALLMAGTMAGILMATMPNNGGGAWDNAKKYIETGMY